MIISCPQTPKILKIWPGPRLEFGVPAVAFQPIGPTLPYDSSTATRTLWADGEDEVASKQAEAVETQFNNRFDHNGHLGGGNAPAFDWPRFPFASQ